MKDFTLIEVQQGRRWPLETLRKTLKSPVWVVRFGLMFGLDARELGALMRLLFPESDIVKALTLEGGDHSGHLQNYVVSLGYDSELFAGVPVSAPEAPDPEEGLIKELFERAEVQIADSLDDLIRGTADAMALMPGKEARMALKELWKVNKKTNSIGTYEAGFEAEEVPENLVIFDVSGSMGEDTVGRTVEEVVAAAVHAKAHLAIVSTHAYNWAPGEYDSKVVLATAEFGGTQYEKLAPLFDRDWGVVLTIADYDSSWSAAQVLKNCPGRIGLLLDISLVSRTTFLAECLAPLADEVRPLMVARSSLTYQY